MNTRLNILIGDDHTLFRKGITHIVHQTFTNAVIEEAADGKEMLEMVKKKNFHIILSDISMPNRIGLEFISELKKAQPQTPLLVLTMHSAAMYVVRVIKAGANGFMNKESAPEELISAMQTLLKGKNYISKEAEELLKTSKNNQLKKLPHQALSKREFEVFKLMVEGLSTLEICDRMNLKATTVSTFKNRIYTKFGLTNVSDLTRYSLEHQLF
jgi:two-component system, NarL family, invasion response regulator UvrY